MFYMGGDLNLYEMKFALNNDLMLWGGSEQIGGRKIKKSNRIIVNHHQTCWAHLHVSLAQYFYNTTLLNDFNTLPCEIRLQPHTSPSMVSLSYLTSATFTSPRLHTMQNFWR